MKPTLCSRCKKNVAVVFITRLDPNGQNSHNEGLCLKCARELNIRPVTDMIEKMGLSDEELEGLTNEMMSAFDGTESMQDLIGNITESLRDVAGERDDDEDEEEGKNINEEPLVRTQIERYRRHDTFSYHKINDSAGAERLIERLGELTKNDINVIVVNFIDMLSHARTESKMVRELANNESAYRSITLSWFRHTVLSDLFKRLAESDYTIVLTTDHGSIRASRPIKIVGDRNTNTNLRYKLGKNLKYNAKEVFAIKEPQKAHLPSPNLSTSYVFATGDTFFAYPNNYNYYVSYYKDTFQHGGISLEEMLIPLVTLKRKKR